MARNRQRAKARRARREANERVTPQKGVAGRRDVAVEAELAASAPPENEGRSDLVAAPKGKRAERAAAAQAKPPPAPAKPAVKEPRQRGRIITFLKASAAELRRVQWPNRQQVTTLSGVVLGFVVIAGTYLGLLDALFSRVVKQII